MAFSNRWQLMAAMAAAASLALAACGDEKKDEEPNNTPRSDGGAGGNPLDALLDGGLNVTADLDDNVAGKACTMSTDCGGTNAACSRVFADTGYCSGVCNDDSNCGAGGKCIKVATVFDTPLSFCAKTCSSNSQCDSELECRKTVDLRGVFDSVVEFLDGGVDGVDVETTPDICQEKAGTVKLANGAVGKPCTTENEGSVCGGGYCDALLSPGGSCTGNCLANSDCGNTGGCGRDFLSATLGIAGLCRLKCTADTDCRQDEGYVCLTSEALFGPGSYCAYVPTFDGGFGFGDAGLGGGGGDAGAPAGDGG
jgi:hypothetical protein